jgi:hypothetical protein
MELFAGLGRMNYNDAALPVLNNGSRMRIVVTLASKPCA